MSITINKFDSVTSESEVVSDLTVNNIERDSKDYVTIYLSDDYYIVVSQNVIDRLKTI